MMTEELACRFVEDGFVRIAGAVPGELALECADLLWAEIGWDRAIGASGPSRCGGCGKPTVWSPGRGQRRYVVAAYN